MEPHLKQELYFHLTQSIRSKITTALSTVCASLILFAVPVVKNEYLKLFLLSGSLAAASAALVSGKTLKEADDALNDFNATTGLNRQRRLLWHQSVQTSVEPSTEVVKAVVEPEKLFDLRTIGDNRNDFPNVFIVGAPGSGKTTLAEYLGIVLKSGLRIGVHPHAKPSDFKGFDRVFGGGRNIGSPEDDPMTWDEIMTLGSAPSVAQVIMGLHGLMQDRYQEYYKGNDKFEPIDVYYDEVPAFAKELGKKFMAKYVPSLIMESRKVGIRLWFLTQAFTVSLLGLEGGSDLKEGATIIRLGKLALNEAQSLANNKRLEQLSLLNLKQETRPALVDETPAKIPGYTEMQAAIDSFVKQKAEALPAKAKTRSRKKVSPNP